MSDRPAVSVFGSSEVARGHSQYREAERVGEVLGGLGYAVANGGYGGAMEGVSRGANRAGATVIGVTCRLWTNRPNEFVDRVVSTDDLYQRLRTLIDLGVAGYVVLPGSTGTLLELAAVWELQNKGIAEARPIVCLGEHWRPAVEAVARACPAAAGGLAFVASPDDLARHFPRL